MFLIYFPSHFRAAFRVWLLELPVLTDILIAVVVLKQIWDLGAESPVVDFQLLQLQNNHIIWVWYCFFHCLWLLGSPTIPVTLHLAKFSSTVKSTYLFLYIDSVLVCFFLCVGFTEVQRSLVKYSKYFSYYSHGFLTNTWDE